MKRGSIFELNGIPKFQEALPLALQHVVAMIVGCVTPAIIVAGAVGGNSLSAKDRVILIQASLVVSALSTLIQLFPIGKKNGFTLGSGLPMIMGVSFQIHTLECPFRILQDILHLQGPHIQPHYPQIPALSYPVFHSRRLP